MINFKYILDNIVSGKIIYILHLKKYQIQSLFNSKLGIKLNKGDNFSIIDTPQGTTRQIIDLCLGGGNFKDLMGYY